MTATAPEIDGALLQKYFDQLCAETNRRAYIYWAPKQQTWLTSRKKTLHCSLLRWYISKAASARWLGVRPGAYTNWLVADIDQGSPYHPASDQDAFDRLVAAFAEWDLACLVIQSTDSGGLHLWFPLPLVSSVTVAGFATGVAEKAGFTVRKGWLELFPNSGHANRKANGIRLPLMHPHSHLLRPGDLLPIEPRALTFGQKLPGFMAAWQRALEANANVFPAVERAEGAGYWSRMDEAEEALRVGFTDHHQTFILMAAACYLAAQQGMAGAAMQRHACRRLREAPGFERWCRHQAEIDSARYNAWVSHYSERTNRSGDDRYRRGGRRPRHHHQDPMPTAAPPKPSNGAIREANHTAITEAVESLQNSWRRSVFATVGEAQQAVANEAQRLGHAITVRTIRRPQYRGLIEPLVPSRQHRAAA